MIPERGYYKSEVTKKTNVSATAIPFYVNAAGIEPYLRAEKKGGNHQFDDANLLELEAADILSGEGVRIHVIRKIIEYIRKEDKLERQVWFDEIMKMEDPPTLAIALVYDESKPMKTEVDFHHIARNAGHVKDAKGKPWTLQRYARTDEGKILTRIIVITDLLKKAAANIR